MAKKTNRTLMIEYMKSIKDNQNRYYYLQTNLKKLIENGVDVSTQGNNGNTLLHLAINLDNIKLLKLFIKYGVRLNLANEQGDTPLHRAINKGRIEMVKVLIKNGADVNAMCEFDQTPLHLCCKNGKIDIAKYLIENGADYLLGDEEQLLPIDYAIDEKDIKIINYFRTFQSLDEDRLNLINDIIRGD